MEDNILCLHRIRIKLRGIENRRELFFYGFILCFVVAKAFGWDSGDTAYKVMGIMGLIFWTAVLRCTKFSPKEYIAVSVLLLISGVSLILSGKLGVILPFLLVMGSKDIEVEKVLKSLTNIWIGAVAFKIFLVLTGIIQNSGVTQGRIYAESAYRYGMGYGHPNMFHIQIFIGITLFCYTHKRLKARHYMGFFLLNLAVFRLSYSTAGVLVTALAVIGFGLIAYVERHCVNYHGLLRLLGISCAVPAVASFVTALAYDQNSARWNKINFLLTGRPKWNYLYMHQYPVPLLGQRFDGRVSNLLDNAYLFVLYRYGLLVFCVLLLGYAFVLARCIKRNDIRKIFFCLVFLAYGFTEQFIQNCFMNFSMFFLCELMWKEIKNNGRD